jgi:hypothetical protein
MVTKRTKLFNPEAYSAAYKVFLPSSATFQLFDLEKQ